MASSAGAAAAGAFSTATESATDAWKVTSKQLHSRVDKLASQIQAFETQVSSRLDELTMDLEYQRWMMKLIFLLLIISFAMDGGMTFALIY